MGKKISLLCIGLFLLIVGSLFYLMNLYTPICGDDYLYSFYLTPEAAKSFFEGTFIGFEHKMSSLVDVLSSQYNHYFYVNGRTVPHVTEQLFAGVLGEDCFNLFNVLFLLLLNALVIWNVDKSKLCNFSYWIITFFFLWFLLPCPVDIMLLMSGAVNYMWSAVYCLFFLLVYSKIKSVDKLSWPISVFLLLFGLIAGWTHEALTIGISGALFINYCMNYKRKPKLPEVLLVIGFWLGTLLLCLSPASRGRAFFDHSSILETIWIMLSEMFAFYVFLFLFIGIFIYEKKHQSCDVLKKFIYDNQLYFYIIFIEFTFSLFIGYRNVRQLFGIELFFILLSLKLIKLKYINDIWLKYVCFIAAGIVIVHMACIIPYAKRTYMQYENLILSYKDSEDGTVYLKKESLPFIFQNYVWRFGAYTDWEAACISTYFTGNKKTMKVLLVDE